MIPNHANGEAPKGFSPSVGLSESLRRLDTRLSQEARGAQSGSGLVKPCIVACVAAAVLMAALTVVPYYRDKLQYDSAKAAAKESPDPTPQGTISVPSPSPDDPAKKPPTSPTDPGKATVAKGKDINDVLGESGTKTAKPGVNPLDNKGDDLLKDIK